MSAGARPLRCSACFAAAMASVAADSSAVHQCRVRMPVREVIQDVYKRQERHLAKVEVASSSLVGRSIYVEV